MTKCARLILSVSTPKLLRSENHIASSHNRPQGLHAKFGKRTALENPWESFSVWSRQAPQVEAMIEESFQRISLIRIFWKLVWHHSTHCIVKRIWRYKSHTIQIIRKNPSVLTEFFDSNRAYREWSSGQWPGNQMHIHLKSPLNMEVGKQSYLLTQVY